MILNNQNQQLENNKYNLSLIQPKGDFLSTRNTKNMTEQPTEQPKKTQIRPKEIEASKLGYKTGNYRLEEYNRVQIQRKFP